MLSGYQMEVVGFHTEDCEAICYACAVGEYGSLVIEKQAMGMTTSVPTEKLRPVVRYEAQEAAGENGYHCGCADDSEVEIPRRGEEPEGYPTDAPVDEGYYRTGTIGREGGWQPLVYHELCAVYRCDRCGEDMAS